MYFRIILILTSSISLQSGAGRKECSTVQQFPRIYPSIGNFLNRENHQEMNMKDMSRRAYCWLGEAVHLCKWFLVSTTHQTHHYSFYIKVDNNCTCLNCFWCIFVILFTTCQVIRCTTDDLFGGVGVVSESCFWTSKWHSWCTVTQNSMLTKSPRKILDRHWRCSAFEYAWSWSARYMYACLPCGCVHHSTMTAVSRSNSCSAWHIIIEDVIISVGKLKFLKEVQPHALCIAKVWRGWSGHLRQWREFPTCNLAAGQWAMMLWETAYCLLPSLPVPRRQLQATNFCTDVLRVMLILYLIFLQECLYI